MAYWYDGAALAATRSPVIALFWCLIKFTTTTTTSNHLLSLVNFLDSNVYVKIFQTMNIKLRFSLKGFYPWAIPKN